MFIALVIFTWWLLVVVLVEIMATGGGNHQIQPHGTFNPTQVAEADRAGQVPREQQWDQYFAHQEQRNAQWMERIENNLMQKMVAQFEQLAQTLGAQAAQAPPESPRPAPARTTVPPGTVFSGREAVHAAKVETTMGEILRISQAAPILDMPGRSRLLHNWSYSDLQSLSNSCPKYSSLEDSFQDYVVSLLDHIGSSGVDYLEDSNSSLLIAMVARALCRDAAILFRQLNGKLRSSNITLIRYLAELSLTIEPPVHSDEYRRIFEARMQKPGEPLRIYVQQKNGLYLKAYPNYSDESNFPQLRDGIIKGIINPKVRERACEIMEATFVSWSEALQTIHAQEVFKTQNGYSSGSKEGLLTETQVRFGKRPQTVHQVQEPRPHGETAARGGEMMSDTRKRCWDCGSYTHFQRSPACKSPGARKFHPKGPGRAYKGGRGQNRPRNPRRGQVHCVEEEEPDVPVESVDTQESFLGETMPPPHPQ